MSTAAESLLALDAAHAWHPYCSTHNPAPVYAVRRAEGCVLELMDGRQLIDGMASWWCVIHGYNHPVLNAAACDQLDQMAHVMFGGLTHAPALTLIEHLVALTPQPLQRVFLCDSGSVAVEVALKMALQYWQARDEPQRARFVSFRHGYHGDTFHAMSVCDPVTGMHRLFNATLPQHWFAPAPAPAFDAPCTAADIAELLSLIETHHRQIAAVIIEPIVQGAGGMRFYSPDYLTQLRQICDQFGLLLIADEIATGFGRTGRLFACEHADIAPDIMTVGKALTGGYLTAAATLTTEAVATTIASAAPGVFMHGPTFMANPLACAIANASIDLLLANDWATNIQRIEQMLNQGLAPAHALPGVAEVRVLGAIGVVEMEQPVDLRQIQPRFVEHGVWVRPFGRLIYLMPPYIISDEQINSLCHAVTQVIRELS